MSALRQIVVHVDPVQNGGVACSLHVSPFNILNPHAVSVTQIDDVAALVGPDVVRQVGERLAAKLRENQALEQVLNLAHADPGPASLPICFRVGDADAHALRWEALVEHNDFVALDPRWPIARIARGGTVPDGTERPFAPPLRLVCVLSAVGRPAIGEWNGIYAAVLAARANSLPVHVTVFAGEEDTVLGPIAALNDPDVDVMPVPATATDLIREIVEREPHLVHFYCHGTIADGQRRLEIGTISDFDRDDGRSSVVVRAEELGFALRPANTWIVTLNTCRGAEAADDAFTHAEDLVNKGVPVAVGMRRVVEMRDAVAFSAAFYPAVFTAIQHAVTAPQGADRQIVWADTLVTARRQLRDEHGADPTHDDAWTVPVLYTRTGSFDVVVSGEADTFDATRMMGETSTIEGFFETVGETVPGGLVDELQEASPNGSDNE